MASNIIPPRRAYEFELKIGADSLDALADALYNLSIRVSANQITQGVSGGYDSGYTYKLDVDETITHDSWYAALNAYLAAKRLEDTHATP